MPALIGYYDATTNKSRTLAPNAQRIIKELGDAPLEITAYNNLLGRFWFLGSPTSYNLNLARWERYIRFKHNIEPRTVLYYDSTFEESYLMTSYPGKTLKEIAEQYAKSMNVNMRGILSPDEIRKIIDLKPEMNRYVMQLKWKDRTTFLRVYDDQVMWPSETEVGAAFKRLMQAKLPKVAFLTGDLERDINKMGDREYKTLTNTSTFRYSLVNQGFDVDSVSLETQEVPADISTLVLADPKIELTPVSMARLQKYIDNGGNLLIACEPGKQSILHPLLDRLGVRLTEGMVIQESKDFSPDLATPELSNFAGTIYKPLKQSLADSQKVSLSGVAGLSYTNDGPFSIQPLLTTDAKLSWNRKQPLDRELFTKASVSKDTTRALAPAGSSGARSAATGTVNFSAADGDVKGPVVTAIALTRKINGREQRIVVTGDADFISNAELNRNNMMTANFQFSTALFSWLSYNEFPIDTFIPGGKDKRVNVTLNQVDLLRIIYCWVLPGLLLLFAAVLLIRRKRK